MDRRSALMATASTLAVGLSLGVGAARAQLSGLKQRIVGTWMLVSILLIAPDGKRTEPPIGPNAKGMLILDPAGYFSWILLSSDIPKVASNSLPAATDAEKKAMGQGTLTYFGTYTVDEASTALVMRIEISSYPNFSGAEQRRTIKLENDELTLTNPTAANAGSATVIWKRAR